MSIDAARREEYWVLSALAAVVFITAAWWALALWPAGASAPQWLVRTQAVCFGVMPNGLPDAAGWTGLIASPLGMFALLFVSGRTAFARIAARARTSIGLRIYAALLGILVTTGAAGATARIHRVAASEAIVVSRTSSAALTHHAAPSLRLVNQLGDTVRLEDFRGREVLVTFAYAHCETVCPIIVHNALQLQAARAASGRPPILLIVTLDPVRDTPARLPTIAREWSIGAEAYVLSGSVAAVERVLDDWRVARSYNAQNGAVAHTALIYEVDTDGVIQAGHS